MIKALGYARVSTAEQARDGYSLAAQERAMRAYCEAHGWQLADMYTESGRSGGSLQGREAMARLMNDAEKGGIHRAIFWRLDRAARSLRDLLDIYDRLEAASVDVVCIQEAFDTGTPAGRMIRNVLGAIAEFERDVTVDRIVTTLAEKARQGELLGPLPLGYRRADGGAVEPDPATAPLVGDLFGRYASSSYSLQEMARWAGEAGLTSARQRPLDRLSIRKILTNVTYTGQVAYHRRAGGGIVAQGHHPGIVDTETFERVQQALARRRRQQGPTRPFGREPYPLSRVAICFHCGLHFLAPRPSWRKSTDIATCAAPPPSAGVRTHARNQWCERRSLSSKSQRTSVA